MIIRVQIGRRRTALARWASHILLGAGAVLMIIVAWSQIESALYQTVQARRFEQGVRETVIPDPAPELAQSHAQHSPRQAPQASKDSLDPLIVGRLEIPRLGLAVMVREGIDSGTLRKAVGHMPGTALPGYPGNFVVAGHRDSFFRRLRLIQNGDEIRVKTRTGAATYYVEALSVVGPSDSQVLQWTEKPVCTLVTCFPFDYIGPAPRRFIVRAASRGDR